ncbi:hypothetical protein QA942_01410 [Streptomyces sp. B21-106]|uniref:hypothetical protein n=1 Tax=Streptomyces sp. B21-106 TaxID=3039418 RepID=UPI002FF1D70D
MTSRSFRARLDRVAKVLGEPQAVGAVCRFHGVRCRMGANWPLPYEPGIEDDVLDLFGDARRSLGLEVAPHPRDLWRTDRHEQVPAEELARERRELEELIAAARARNDQLEAEIRGDHIHQ